MSETPTPLHQLDPELMAAVNDPVERLLLFGRARTVSAAQELYLNSAYDEAVALLASPLTEADLTDHPLLRLYRSCGSPAGEDSLR